ncbi:hypothetical protein K458DRAFT_404764 [Lentithecium fluviatile CBS 122367]|uniref:Uncharacterized protein n=1 Tax=Lentithecium fluviatile CBS 122367 TaxID=1168545 RepID=A0A6G1J115_9PLEO|nr:hypothetical protein K458DRAFT_404764 [Lentithecium fluviatile CBS 122367]
MATEGSTSQMEGQLPMTEPHPGPSSFIPGPNRRDTMSTVSSERHNSVPAGAWHILIHGNCTSCGHHHKAATIPFKVSDDPSEASDVLCERCGHKWLTLGGLNTTQISLLSTLTTDADKEDVELRCTLVEIVRSATGIMSPGPLSSVPEDASHVPSRENSTRNKEDNAQRIPEPDTHHIASDAVGSPRQTADQDTAAGSRTFDHQSTGRELLSNNVELTKAVLRSLKRKLRRHFPILKKVHLTKFIRPEASKEAVEAPKNPFPTEPRRNETPPLSAGPPAADTDEQKVNENEQSQPKDAEDVCTPAMSAAQAIDDAKKFPKETIRNMTPEQRALWIREQITAFKCRCSRQCSCRHSRRSSSFMVDGGTRVHILSPLPSFELPRRHSLEGIGSHLTEFPPGMFFTDGRPPTISATRTSEAETIVESNTIGSSPRNSRVDFVQRQRHRSWSPRPTSLISYRQPLQQLAQHRLVAQNSMDSIITGGAVRSSSRGGRRRPDRSSLPPPATPLRIDSVEVPSRPSRHDGVEAPSLPSQPGSEEVPSRDNEAGPQQINPPEASRARPATSSTSRTEQPNDEERDRGSDSTPPVDAPRS